METEQYKEVCVLWNVLFSWNAILPLKPNNPFPIHLALLVSPVAQMYANAGNIGSLLLAWTKLNPGMIMIMTKCGMQLFTHFPNFNRTTVEVCEWTSNFLPTL